MIIDRVRSGDAARHGREPGSARTRFAARLPGRSPGRSPGREPLVAGLTLTVAGSAVLRQVPKRRRVRG